MIPNSTLLYCSQMLQAQASGQQLQRRISAGQPWYDSHIADNCTVFLINPDFWRIKPPKKRVNWKPEDYKLGMLLAVDGTYKGVVCHIGDTTIFYAKDQQIKSFHWQTSDLATRLTWKWPNGEELKHFDSDYSDEWKPCAHEEDAP